MKLIIDFRKYDRVVGGVEQGALQIARHAAARGDRVIMLCRSSRTDEVRGLFADADGVAVHPLPVETHLMGPRNAWMDSVVIQDLAVREGADLIHFYYNWSFPFRRKVPCLLTVHDVIPFTFREAMGWWRNHFLYRPSLRAACRLNDLIVTVSEFSRSDIARKVGVPLEKIRVIPNGLREPAREDPDMRRELTERFGLQEGYLLNVGGIHERKNMAVLLRAFALLREGQGYRGRLVITGSVSGAPYQERMKRICDALIAELGIGDAVVFTGFISEEELDHLLRGADVFVYPSLYEGFGIPILEAMKVGTPVVTSNCTAMPEVAGEAALLVDPTDAAALAEAVGRLLRDEALRGRLVELGRRRAEGYSWERTVSEYYSIYHQLAGRGD